MSLLKNIIDNIQPELNGIGKELRSLGKKVATTVENREPSKDANAGSVTVHYENGEEKQFESFESFWDEFLEEQGFVPTDEAVTQEEIEGQEVESLPDYLKRLGFETSDEELTFDEVIAGLPKKEQPKRDRLQDKVANLVSDVKEHAKGVKTKIDEAKARFDEKKDDVAGHYGKDPLFDAYVNNKVLDIVRNTIGLKKVVHKGYSRTTYSYELIVQPTHPLLKDYLIVIEPTSLHNDSIHVIGAIDNDNRFYNFEVSAECDAHDILAAIKPTEE